MHNQPLSSTYANWIAEMPWDHVAHLTFKFSIVTVDFAFLRLENWSNGLARFTQGPIQWVAFPEHTIRDVVHLHALLMGTGSLNPKIMAERWRRRNGFVKIDTYRVGVGIERYITKAVFPDFSEGRFSNSCVGLAEGEDNAPSDSEGH